MIGGGTSRIRRRFGFARVAATCKPNFVYPEPFDSRRSLRTDDHFSAIPIARNLKATYPRLLTPRDQGSPHIWSCCRWGLPCRPCHHERGALLPHHFTLAEGSGFGVQGSVFDPEPRTLNPEPFRR